MTAGFDLVVDFELVFGLLYTDHSFDDNFVVLFIPDWTFGFVFVAKDYDDFGLVDFTLALVINKFPWVGHSSQLGTL